MVCVESLKLGPVNLGQVGVGQKGSKLTNKGEVSPSCVFSVTGGISKVIKHSLLDSVHINKMKLHPHQH